MWCEHPLPDWWFTSRPAETGPESLPPGAWRQVRVPHLAETGLDDVRRGGSVTYRTSVSLDPEADTHQLHFEAVSYRCRVAIDGRPVAEHEGAWDPFIVDIPVADQPEPFPTGRAAHQGGRTVEVVVTVEIADYADDSPLHFRSLLLGFVPDTAGPFGGLWRAVTYRSRRGPYLPDLRVVAEQDDPAVRVTWRPPSVPAAARVEVSVECADGTVAATDTAPAAAGAVLLSCPTAARWSPEAPVLHLVRVRLLDTAGELLDEQESRVGFRQVAADGRAIHLDGTPVYLRGVLHWGHYPELGTPAAAPDQVRAELELIRSLGFNAVKVCLFLAPKHFYDVCDELGLLVWQEFPLWLPRDNAYLSERVHAQYPRLVDMVAAHPSVVLVSLGCELERTVPSDLLAWAYQQVRQRMPNILICANSGSGECFGGGRDAPSDIYDYHFYADPHQLDELMAAFTGQDREPHPWLFGEYNDADTWRTAADLVPPGASTPAWLSPDPAVNALRSVHAGFASDQQVYRQAEIIAAEGYPGEVAGLRELSHRQARDTRKLVWELTRSQPGVSGYIVTVLRDVPPTTSGLLDDYGAVKFDAADIARCNADVVLAVRAPRRRAWYRGGDRLRVLDPFNMVDGGVHAFAVRVANAGGSAGPAELEVRLCAGGQVLVADTRAVTVPAHTVREVADIEWMPAPIGADGTVAARLSVIMRLAGVVLSANEWPVLIHPAAGCGRPVLLHDPSGRLDGLAEILGARPVRDEAELAATLTPGVALVTTAYGPRIRELTAAHGLRTFAAEDGRYFPVRPAPFWRENVMRIHPDTWLSGTMAGEHAGIPLGAVAGDGYIPRAEITRRVGVHTPLLTRYDTRTYAVGAHLFEWSEGAGRTAVSTLRLAGGTGTQPRTVTDNPMALAIIGAYLRTDT